MVFENTVLVIKRATQGGNLHYAISTVGQRDFVKHVTVFVTSKSCDYTLNYMAFLCNRTGRAVRETGELK